MANEALDKLLVVRISEAEKRILQEAARKKGFSSDSEWIRLVLREEAQRILQNVETSC